MLSSFILTAMLLAMPSSHSNGIMKLIDTKTDFVLIEFKNGHPKFHHGLLEAILKDWGVSIPSNLQEHFEGKRTIFLDDPLFEKAFVEVYCLFHLRNPIYQWIKESEQTP